MALNNKAKEEQGETVLIGQLKEELNSKDITQTSSPRRIASIDFVKGIAIIIIILCHTSAAWFDESWVYLHGIFIPRYSRTFTFYLSLRFKRDF